MGPSSRDRPAEMDAVWPDRRLCGDPGRAYPRSGGLPSWGLVVKGSGGQAFLFNRREESDPFPLSSVHLGPSTILLS